MICLSRSKRSVYQGVSDIIRDLGVKDLVRDQAARDLICNPISVLEYMQYG